MDSARKLVVKMTSPRRLCWWCSFVLVLVLVGVDTGVGVWLCACARYGDARCPGSVDVVDATTMKRVARIALPARVPAGFHALWIPEEEQ
jgi:carotenoid cleavage dioxygenase-like enzyme